MLIKPQTENWFKGLKMLKVYENHYIEDIKIVGLIFQVHSTNFPIWILRPKLIF